MGGISTRKHLIMKDLTPKFDKGHSKFLVKVFVWDNGSLTVIEKTFDTKQEAFAYSDSLDYPDASIKIYNEHSVLVRSEHTKGKHHGWDLYA